MLTIPADRIADLLEKAAEVDIDVEDEDAAQEDAAYLALLDAVEALSSGEVHELLILHSLGDEESEAESWDEAAEVVQAIPAEERIDALIDALLLAEGIEAALEELGYGEEEAEGEGEEEEEGDEETGDEATP